MNDEMSQLHVYRDADYSLSGNLYALLRPGQTVEQLNHAFRQQNLKMTFGPEECPVAAFPFGHDFLSESGYGIFAVIFLVLGTLILLVGLLNFFSFACGSYLNRLREYALRRVSGSRPRQLLGLLFTQAALTVALAFLVAGCLVEVWVPRLHISLDNFRLVVDGGELLGQCAQYLAALLLLTLAVCAGTVAYAVRIPIQTGIRGTGRVRRGGRHIARNALLAVQFFACWVFVALAAALYLQTGTLTEVMFNTLSNGQKKEILSIPLDYTFLTEADKQSLIDRMKRHAGVEDCLIAEENYAGNMRRTGFFADEQKKSEQVIDTYYRKVAPNFFRFMNLPLLQGDPPRDSTYIVIDQKTAANLTRLTGKEVMGSLLYPWSRPAMTVCGLAGDLNTYMYAPPKGWDSKEVGYTYWFSDFSLYTGHCYLKCRPGQTDAVRRHVTAVLTETLPPTIPRR